MAFWSTNFGEKPAQKDPKRNFRFTVQFTGISAPQGGAVMWYAKTAAKPSFAIAAAEHKYLNHTYYYPGSVTWNDVTVTLVDPVEPDMTATLSDIVVQSGYSPPTDSTNESMGTMSKSKAAGALGTVIITQIDADGKPMETWTLINSFITDLKYGDSLAYGDDELTELSVTVKYDWAKCETTNPSRATYGDEGTKFFEA